MPPIHHPRFMHSRRSRSRSPRPPLADASDDAPVASPGLDSSRSSSSRFPSRLVSSEQDRRRNATASASRLSVPISVPRNPIQQYSTRRSPSNRAPVDFGGQPSWASQPVTPIGAVPSSAISTLSSHDSVVQLDIQVTPPSDDTHSVQAQPYLAPPPSFATPSQQCFHSEPPIPPVGQDSPQRQYKQQGMFDHAHDFSMTGPTFIDGNIAVTNNINTISSQFMKELLKETIPGAASDSSARYPPPRCHPGTRLAVLERCLYFIANCVGATKIRWVFGAAGVGKSAVMQSVADSPNLPVTCHVSVFFSINGRDDGTKAIITLCYQLAAKSAPYRQLIEREVKHDPSLLQSSMPVQFENFFIQPFIHSDQLKSAGRVLILIDGLDECNRRDIQLELLRLISNFCITYPSSPLVWLIASRPERHITSFFARANVMPAYEKEEIQVDSDEGRADVEQFLRERLEVIKEGSDSFDPHSKWPEEKDFWKLAKAAGGLFAYAHTVIRYIGDSNVGSPALQLSEVLKVIDNLPLTGIPRAEHPMALLDALYARILSNVPAKVIIHTRKLVLALASRWDEALDANRRGSFVVLCNWLAMTPDEAYAAVNQLQSLLRTPRRHQAHLKELKPFHKSFIDYVSDSSRSDFFSDMHHEARQLKTECAFRVLKEAPDGVDSGDLIYKFRYGTLRRGPGTGDKISLTWPLDECEKDTQLNMYKLAIGEVLKAFGNGDPTFTSEFCLRLLITQFFYHSSILEFPQQVFDESRRHEFMRCGILKQMPLKAIPCIAVLRRDIMLLFRRPARAVAPGVSTVHNAVALPSHHPARAVTSLSDPWNSSCKHEREGEWEEGKDQDWRTTFREEGIWSSCAFCCGRFERQLGNWKTFSPDHTVLVLFTSSGNCCVELRFVDPDDGISEWTYWYWTILSRKERKKYGSTV